MSITAISFYWRNDTPSFVTWRSRLATAPDTPTCIVIHGGQFTGGVHSQISSSLRLSVICLFLPHLLVIHYWLFLFSKELISFIGTLDKCHTSVFNALINCVIWDIFIVRRKTTLTISDSIETGSQVRTEVVRVISLRTTEITERTR